NIMLRSESPIAFIAFDKIKSHRDWAGGGRFAETLRCLRRALIRPIGHLLPLLRNGRRGNIEKQCHPSMNFRIEAEALLITRRESQIGEKSPQSLVAQSARIH